MAVRTGRFARADRLLRSQDFQRVSRVGSRAASRHFVVLLASIDDARRAPGAASRRLGITVSRKVGGAVVRNRVKRRVRAWFRASRDGLPDRTDLVVIARAPAVGLTWSDLCADLGSLVASAERELP